MEEQPSSHFSVIGHETILDFLRSSARNDRLSHAYIFFGADSAGRRPVAEHFSAFLLCTGAQKPCGACSACLAVKKGTHPDIFSLAKDEEKKNIIIEHIRILIEKLSLSSFLSGYKVAIIDGAEDMNREAANALLKTLEEPTPKTILILIAHSLEALPETIASRCQTIRFSSVEQKTIEQALIAEGAERSQAERLSRLAQGAPGKALRFFRESETLKEYEDSIRMFCTLADAKDIASRFAVFEPLTAEKKSAKQKTDKKGEVIERFRGAIRDCLCLKVGAPELVVNDFCREELLAVSERVSPRELLHLYAYLRRAQKLLKENVNPRIIFENFALMF